jgi:hypothetical protein
MTSPSTKPQTNLKQLGFVSDIEALQNDVSWSIGNKEEVKKNNKSKNSVTNSPLKS